MAISLINKFHWNFINKQVSLELQLSINHSLFSSYIVLFYNNYELWVKCCVSNDIGIYFWFCFGMRIIILLYFLIAVLTSTGVWYMFNDLFAIFWDWVLILGALSLFVNVSSKAFSFKFILYVFIKVNLALKLMIINQVKYCHQEIDFV